MRTRPQLKFPALLRLIPAAALAVSITGCAATAHNNTETAQAKRTSPQGSFDTRCYYAMRAVEASANAGTFTSQGGTSALTVCTVAEDEKSLSFFFFSPGTLGGSALFTVSLPDYQVLSVKPQK